MIEKSLRKKISMQDIANHLNISKNAVSLALNNKPGVSEELRKMVVKAAQDLNYGGFGKSEKKKNNILVLIPEYISNDKFFYNDIYWSIEKEAKSREYNAIMSSVSSETQDKLILPSLYFEIEFCGIIIIGIFKEEYVKKLLELKVPLITVDQYYESVPLDAVTTANHEGAYQIVKYLIDNGHKDIGYIGSIKMSASLYDRWNGFKKAMLIHGLKVNESHCILNSSPLCESGLLSDIYELERYINEMDTFPTAWFCGGDRIAIALINVLTKKSIRVPDDISVVGFDDIEASKMIYPPLTTLRVKRELMGREVVDFLISRLEKEGEIKNIALYGELIIRDSVKKLID